MKTKIIILGLVLSLVPAVANARGYHPHIKKVHVTNPYKGLRHQRLKIARKGTILVYNP